MPDLEVNGTALRYEPSGSGSRASVLLHETGGSLASWELVAPRLAAERRVLRYDARGAGMSEKVRGRLGLDTLLADLGGAFDGARPPRLVEAIAGSIRQARYLLAAHGPLCRHANARNSDDCCSRLYCHFGCLMPAEFFATMPISVR